MSISPRAPKSTFRVIAEDTFPYPPEEYLVGDYDTEVEARNAAGREEGPMTIVRIFDNEGNRVV